MGDPSLFDLGTDPDVLRARIAEAEAEKARYNALGQDAKRTYRNQRSLDNGVHPTTKRALLRDRPEDERIIAVLAGVNIEATCGDCRFCESMFANTRSYVKCKAVPLTHGPGSDTRKKWPACTKFQARR